MKILLKYLKGLTIIIRAILVTPLFIILLPYIVTTYENNKINKFFDKLIGYKL